METTIREGYVRKSKVLWKSMKKRYLVLRSSSEMSRTGQLEFYDDHKQVKKKPTTVISLTLITSVKKIETPSSSGASQKDGGYFIRLDVKNEKNAVEELFLGVETREQLDDWLSDLEFLVRLPDLVIPLSLLPKREVPLTQQTLINKNLFRNVEFEDACPVEVLKTEIGLKWQFNNRFFILILSRSTLVFLDPTTGLRALTYPIQNLRRCGHWQKLVFIESGRRTDTGPGYLWMFVHSKFLAKSFYSTLSNVMGSTLPLLVTQRYLCWDKFREELPQVPISMLSDAGNQFQAPIVDNENYFAPDAFDHTAAQTELPQPINTLQHPPLPPNHPIPMGQTPPHLQSLYSKVNKTSTLSRKDDPQLPPIPGGGLQRRASLPGKDRFAAESSEVRGTESPEPGLPKQKSQTVCGGDADRIKKRYDILLIGDTPELEVAENGQVVTKITHAITDGKGNVVKEQATPPSHSYYDVNEMISKLTINKKSSPSLGRKIAKLNTISTKKLSSTSAKEKIGNSTFYKGSLPLNNPNIAPYAEFSDLDSQIPADVRKERLRILSSKVTQSMDNPTDTGSPLPPHTPVKPQTPLLYSSPSNFPVDEVYRLVDPKPRPVKLNNSSKSLPEDVTPEELARNQPANEDYQCPPNNSEVHLSAASRDSPIIITEYDGDYDRLAAAARDSLDIIRESAPSCRTPSPCYESMVSVANGESTNRDGDDSDEVTISVQPDSIRGKRALETLVESQVMDSSPSQDALPPEAGRDESRDVYEVMVDMARKNSNPTPLYSNVPFQSPLSPLSPPQSAGAATSRKGAAFLRKQGSSPLVTQQKPMLNKGTKSFSFRSESSSDGDLYYADLELNGNKRDATLIINSTHANGSPTQYDKIDHKMSRILNETVQQHREKPF